VISLFYYVSGLGSVIYRGIHVTTDPVQPRPLVYSAALETVPVRSFCLF